MSNSDDNDNDKTDSDMSDAEQDCIRNIELITDANIDLKLMDDLDLSQCR